MASNTPNLNLYKSDPTVDGNLTFNIKTMLNDNWDKIDSIVAKKTDLPTKVSQLSNDSNFITSLGAPVQSVNNKTGTITLSASDVGAEPTISTKNSAFNQSFETSASNIKMDGVASAGFSNNVARADHVHPTDTSKAPLASPALTGTPTAPTATQNTNTTQIATTAFVQATIAALIGSAPTLLNTLQEIDTAINNDPNLYNDIMTAINNALSTSETYTNNITGTLSSLSTNTKTTLVAAINEVLSDVNLKAPLASPTFSGTVKTLNNTLDDGNGNMSIAKDLTLPSSSYGININSPTSSGTWARAVNYLANGSSTILGGIGAFGNGNSITNYYMGFGTTPWNNSSFSVSSNNAVSTKNNTLDDGYGSSTISGQLTMGADIIFSQASAHIRPKLGTGCGFTNSLGNIWALYVIDNGTTPVAKTLNNVLDDGNGNMTVKGNITMSGDVISDGSERRFKASQGWGLFVNSAGCGLYDWTNARSVLTYAVSSNNLQLIANKITTYNNTLDDGSGNMTLKGSLTMNNGCKVLNERASCSDTKLTTTSATSVASFTPTNQGNFEVKSYLRVTTAATNVTLTITYTDASGAQTNTVFNNQSFAVGSYSLPPTFINALNTGAITVTFTAGTANQVYVSTAIVEV